MAKRDPKQTSKEKAIFDAFLTAYPSFAATVIDHEPPKGEFPDRVVRLKDGSQIEFELAQWLHSSQTAMAKRRQQLSDAIEEAIGTQTNYTPQHVRSVMLVPKHDLPRFDKSETLSFRNDVWALIEETEQRWPRERSWQSPQGRHAGDLKAHPTLNKYVSRVIFEPLKVADFWHESRPGDVPWIFVECPGGSYSPDTAIGAMQKILEAKISAYARSHSSVRLLVYYGAAVACNTPWYGIKTRKFSDVAKEAARIAASQSTFERIYLLKALEPELEAYEVFPVFTKCK